MRGLMVAIGVCAAAPVPLLGQIVIRGPGGTLGGPGSAMEMLDRAPSGFGVGAWHVGEWARYSVSGSMGPATLQQFRTMSVVGQDGDRFWVEVAEETVSPARIQVPTRKMLIPFGPVTESAMSEMLVLRADSSVRRETVVRPGKGPAASPSFPREWKKVGNESLEVRAGTFQTVHYKKEGQDVWASGAAGPIGIVRMRTETSTLELVAHETSGAKSQIAAGSAQ